MAANNQTYEQLATAFRHHNFQPLYFLYGEERYLMEAAQADLLENALAPHERDFNLDIVYGPEADARSVLGLCTSYPMMAERRVVIVRDFENLEDNLLFKEYAEQPNPTAIVMLVCGTKPNLNSHPYRALRSHAVSMESKALYSSQMPGWIKKTAEAKGYRIAAEAVNMLVENVGTSLRAADEELEKLTTFAGERKTISADDVVRASGQTRDYNVFELQRAIGEGRGNDAFRIAERMLQTAGNSRGEALMIVAILNAYFSKLWKLSAAPAAVSNKDLASRIGVPPYFLKEYLASLRRYSVPSIEEAFLALLAADYELKGGATHNEQLVMSLLLRRIVSASA